MIFVNLTINPYSIILYHLIIFLFDSEYSKNFHFYSCIIKFRFNTKQFITQAPQLFISALLVCHFFSFISILFHH